jgi:UPF0271 protein
MSLEIEPLGELAYRIVLPPGVDRRALVARLRALPGAVDACATEGHAMVRFERDPVVPDASILADEVALPPPREHVVRARYDGEDLEEVAREVGLSTGEVIRLHADARYIVSVVGFLPGFGYLRGLAPALACVPRRASPRPRVPAGAIAVAGGFTGIYPCESPGGWRLIGHAMGFEPLEGEHVRLAVGDVVTFERVP